MVPLAAAHHVVVVPGDDGILVIELLCQVCPVVGLRVAHCGQGFVLGNSIVHIVEVGGRLHLIEDQLVESVATVGGKQVIELQRIA